MYKIYADGELLCDSSIQELAIISPIVKLAANSAGSFEFTLPATHPYINSIERRSTIISVYIDEDTTPTFQGIATEEDEDFYKNVTFICEGELTYLNDTIQRQVKYTSLTVRQVLEAIIAVHNSQVSSDKQFTVGQVTINDTITCCTNYNSTLTEIKENLVDEFGGYIRIRYASGTKYIDYLADSPRTNSQIIKLGENLLDYKSNINDTEIATSILPLGNTLDTQVVEGLDAYLTITSAAADAYHPSGADYIYSSDAVSNYGFIQKVVTWNDITSATDLLAKAEAYLSDIQFENVVLSVSAIDMAYLSSDEEHFKVLDKIRVVSTAHGMDRYFILSEQTLNLNNPEEDQITLGINEQLSLSAKAASTNAEILGKIEQLPTSNMVQSAIDNATALITGAEGGYVVITRNSDGQPTEIKIQDALESPTKIWRWNVNGLGYSSDGGATYGLAMTMNGAIVADYITSGTMYADRIKGGELLIGGSGTATNGTIEIKDANNITMISISKYGMTLYDASGNGKAYLDHSGLTISGGTVNASTIHGSTIDGSVKIQTDEFSVDSSGNVTNKGDLYTDGEISGKRVIGRVGVTCQDLYVTGSKDRIVNTSLGWLSFEAYETPVAYFGDIGEGTTDANGECNIEIDEKFLAATKAPYHIFIQAYDGAELSISKSDTSFRVYGTPNASFSYEIKGVQIDKGERFKEIPDYVIREEE